MFNINDYAVYVFDFDGTLVKSNSIKENAYYKVFDSVDETYIGECLQNANLKSRFEIINCILKMQTHTRPLKADILDFADKYNKSTIESVKICEETYRATEVLSMLSKVAPLYLSSLTPKEPLLEIVRYRDMEKYFKGIFGYPSLKDESLGFIQNAEQCSEREIMVIGDGVSDKKSAAKMGCDFFQVFEGRGLLEFEKSLIKG